MCPQAAKVLPPFPFEPRKPRAIRLTQPQIKMLRPLGGVFHGREEQHLVAAIGAIGAASSNVIGRFML